MCERERERRRHGWNTNKLITSEKNKRDRRGEKRRKERTKGGDGLTNSIHASTQKYIERFAPIG